MFVSYLLHTPAARVAARAVNAEDKDDPDDPYYGSQSCPERSSKYLFLTEQRHLYRFLEQLE